jgi:transposase-like protein
MIKTDMQPTAKTRRQFNETFKREALNNWKTSGKSAGVVAKELGILPNRLYAWQQRFAPADTAAKPASAADLQSQLNAARREIRHLTEQRDILKKTLGILSEPPSNATNGSTR